MAEYIDVDIKGKNHHYSIDVGQGVLETIAKDLSNPEELKSMGIKPSSRFAIITDSNVKPLYADSLEKSLKCAGLDVNTHAIEAGEHSKSRKTRDEVEDWMFEQGYGRDTVILAVGGGVVGDLAGYVASEFLRGIPYIQVPTTLLAQVDSSVGGKTGIDVPYGKNLIGAFKQPVRVYIDPKTILTLDDRNLISGLAEVIKYGVIQDAEFFQYLQENIDKILAKDLDALTYTAMKSCEIKADVVMEDEKETKGKRVILNFGHTVGHAVEHLSRYELLHGEAVAIGMLAEARIAVAEYGFPESQFLALEQLLEKAGLPTRIPLDIPDKEIRKTAAFDKKSVKGRAGYSLPTRIGGMRQSKDGSYITFVENDVVDRALDARR